MDIHHLRYFLQVASSGSFTKAAEELGMAQPPLSRQIHNLEVELGARLLDRKSRPLQLTEVGHLVFDQAQQVVSGVDEIKRSVQRLAGLDRMRFAIGCVGSTIYGAIPQIIRRFRASAPHTDVHLLEMTTLEQISALKEGRINVGIGRVRFDDPLVRREVLLEEPLIVALSSEHSLALRQSSVRLADLSHELLIVYPNKPRPSYADQVLSFFRDHAMPRSSIQEVRELQTALGLVAAGAGICLVPESVSRLHRDDVIYRQIADSSPTSPVIMSWRAGDVSAQLQLFGEITSDMYQRHKK